MLNKSACQQVTLKVSVIIRELLNVWILKIIKGMTLNTMLATENQINLGIPTSGLMLLVCHIICCPILNGVTCCAVKQYVPTKQTIIDMSICTSPLMHHELLFNHKKRRASKSYVH